MTSSADGDSLPKPVRSSAFNHPWPFPDHAKRSLLYELKSRLTIAGVYFSAKLMFTWLNKMSIQNRQTFIKAVEDRSRPLITVSNHRCNIDDPLIWAMFTIPEFFRNIHRYRYVLAAHNICFTNRVYTNMFALGRCVPCVRGEGIFQRGVDECISALSRNEWVHVFPEGRVTPQPIRIKWGVARMIEETTTPPVILPIWLEGMQSILSETKPYYPRIGQEVKVLIGDIYDTSHLLSKFTDLSPVDRRKRIADFVQEYLFQLGQRAAE